MDALPASPGTFASRTDAGESIVPKGQALVLFVSIAATAFAAVLILIRTRQYLAPADFAPLVGMAGGLLALARFCDWRYPDKRLAHCAGIVAVGLCGLVACGIVSNTGLRLQAPLADARLASLDAAIGIDAGAVITQIASIPWLTAVLSFAYNASGLLVVGLIAAFAFTSRFAKAWELVTTTVTSMQVVALVSLAAPAWGAMRHFGLEALQGRGLPPGAGVYQWPAFAHFYEGHGATVHISDMGGVVAFPSFHTVLALVITQALAETRLRWIGVGCSATVILAAIPMGGHYAADLLAGWLVWLGAALVARRVSNPSG